MFLGITHPFAVGLNPLDLHVLGTPPAFILSQDQTLQKILYEEGNPKGVSFFMASSFHSYLASRNKFEDARYYKK